MYSTTVTFTYYTIQKKCVVPFALRCTLIINAILLLLLSVYSTARNNQVQVDMFILFCVCFVLSKPLIGVLKVSFNNILGLIHIYMYNFVRYPKVSCLFSLPYIPNNTYLVLHKFVKQSFIHPLPTAKH